MRRFLPVLLSAIAAVPLFAADAAIPETNAVLAAAAFIKTTQSADGSYATDALGQNMDAIFAVRAAEYDPAKDLVGGKGPLQFLTANADAATSPAAAAKAALGAKALGLDPKAVGGVDLIAKIVSGFDATKGTYANDDFSQSIAMLGLACTGSPVPASAAAALKATAVADGGGWGFGGFADHDTTAIAIQALLASGTPKSDPAVVKGLAYLKLNQGNDGGWGFDPDESNTSSTAYVVQALIALGENPDSPVYEKAGVTPAEYLVSQQSADGSFKGFDAAYATNQVVPALAGRTFCNAPETPITRTRPVVVATPTAAASTPASVSPTTAPKPPSTGATRERTGGSGWLGWVGVALLAASIAGIATSVGRRGR